MRVLWFSNVPSLAASEMSSSNNLTGWIPSLERNLSSVKDIHLGVAFPSDQKEPASFRLNNTEYYSFPAVADKGKYKGLIDRWIHKIESDDYLKHYLNIIAKFNPDLIHIFGSEGSFGEVIGHVNVPVLLQIQGNLSVCTLKYFSGFSQADALKYSARKSFILGYSTWHQFFTFRKRAERERRLMRNCKYIIGRTDWDRYVTKVLSPGSRYFHCDEILRDQFYKSRWKRNYNRKFRIVSTLSGSTYKGFDVVLSAASLLNNYNLIDFEWHIVGIEERHEIISIIEKARKMKFTGQNIIFNGMLNAVELAEILLSSDCYVHPSYIENSSNSISEAMLLGLPVIATLSGGTVSIIDNKVEGLLVEPGDPYALAGAIKTLADSPEDAEEFATRARQRALARHDPDKIIANITGIYKTVLNS